MLGLPHGRPTARLVRARYGRDTVEAAFDAILDRTTETYRREILSKIPDGTYVWEDYAEHDGVDDPQAAHPADHPDKQSTGGPGRIPLDGGPLLTIDFTGTAPQAKGPINHCGDYVGGTRSGSRPSCATWPTPRSGWPSSTSTRASCRSSR